MVRGECTGGVGVYCGGGKSGDGGREGCEEGGEDEGGGAGAIRSSFGLSHAIGVHPAVVLPGRSCNGFSEQL